MPRKPPTALQLARCGHIAVLLREEMSKRGWTTRHLCEALGLKHTATTPYPWINGTSAPSAKWQFKLADVLGHPSPCFAPRDIDADQPAPTLIKPATVPAVQIQPQRPPAASSEVLGFKVNSDGTARVTLDIVLPLATAAPLLRMLLDAGLMFGDAPSE